MTLLRTLSKNAKGSGEGGKCENALFIKKQTRGEKGLTRILDGTEKFHLVTLPSKTPPSLLASSKYRDTLLEMANILRTKSYKYEQIRHGLMDPKDPRRVCAMGLYYSETNGYGGPINMEWYVANYHTVDIVEDFNDYYKWTFDQIADELERGVSIIQ